MNNKNSLGADFRARIITASVGAPLVLLITYLGFPAFGAMVVLTSLLCAAELQQIIAPANREALTVLVLLVLSCFVSVLANNYAALVVALLTCLLFRIAWASFTSNMGLHAAVRNYFYLVLGALYIGLPLSILLMLRNLDQGALWTIVMFANNWATDGFALIGGRLWGKHKLAPRISPGKTIEGVVVGLCVGFSLGMVVSVLGHAPLSAAIVVNLVITVLTIMGDLLESSIKRFFSVKDAGSLLPGHGGFLDRIDGLLLAIPVLYFVLSRI